MKIPASIRIGYRDYKVNKMSQQEMDKLRYGFKPPGSVAACHDAKNCTISIVTGEGSAQNEAAFLLHEVLHGCLAQLDDDRLTPDFEERLVLSLEDSLCCVIKDNPKFIDYLKETL